MYVSREEARRRAAETEAFKAKLAMKFARRCCACGLPAMMVVIGQDPVRQAGIRLTPGRPDRNLCLFHAGLAKVAPKKPLQKDRPKMKVAR